MELKDQVQGVVLGLFGAYAGAHLADLTAQAEAGNPVALVEGLVNLQPVLLGADLNDDATWVDLILGHMGIASTSAAYDAAADWANGELAAGATRAEVIIAAVTYLLGDTVEAQYADVAAAFQADVAAGIEWSEGDGADVLGIADLRAEAGNVVVFNLTAALATLAAAETAKADFIAAQDLDEDPDTDTAEADITALIDAAAAAGNPVRDFNGDYGTTLGSTSTVNARNAAYAVERAAAEALVLAEEDDVAAAQAAVDAFDADAEIAAYQAAKAADDAAAEALSDATATFNGAVAFFETKNTGADPVLTVNADGTAVFNPDDGGVGVDVNIIILDGTTLKLGTGVTEALYPGVTALLSASTALEAAEAAKAETAQDLTDATDALPVGALAALTTLETEQGQLEDAQEAAADLEAAIADVEAAYALNAQLDALNDDIADAVTAINNGDWNVVTLDGPANANADAFDNDVFLFNGDAAAITNFGAVGSDLIKFAAGEYTVVVVDAADWGVKAAGSSSALEIFVVDGGANTTLYVEENAFDGSTVAAQGNAIAITLTGVTGEDFALTSAGYLSVA